MLSSLVPIYQGKGHRLDMNSHSGIKLMKLKFKFYARVLDKRLRDM